MIKEGDVVQIKGTELKGYASEFSPSDGIWYVETYELGVITALPSDLKVVTL